MAVEPSQIEAARRIVAQRKLWVAGAEIPWREASARSFEFRVAVETDAGLQPAGLSVSGFYKPSRIEGARDKLQFSMICNGRRIVGVDDGYGGHVNREGGLGMPFYRHRVHLPHVHFVCDDAIEGYAEPLPVMPMDGLWREFTGRANIEGAPAFALPRGTTWELKL